MRHPKDRPLRAEGINRRQFLMRSAGAAAAIPAASAILAACGDSNGGSSGSASADQLAFATREKPATLPIRDSNPPIASDLPPESGATLRLFNWDAYLNKKVLGDFEKKYDCNVEVTTFGTWDEAVAKIKSGQGDWDVYFATLDLIDRLQVEELIQPLNHDYIPNLKNVWPQFGSDPNEPFYDQGSRYSVPYALYSTGVGFRNDLVAEEDQPQNLDNSFDLLWNAKYKGKIGLYDDWGFTMAVAMARNGFTDINNATQVVIDETVDSLLEANATVNPGYGINITYEDLPKGAFVATTAWSGDMIAAPYYGKDSAAATAPLLTYYDKGYKGLAGSDTMVVLSTSQSPVLAHLFLNHMLDEEEAFKNMGWVGYQHPQKAMTREYFADRGNKYSWIVFPNMLETVVTPEGFAKAEIFYDWPAEMTAMWAAGWDQVVSG